MTTLSIILLSVIVVETIVLVILLFKKRRSCSIGVPCEAHDSGFRFTEEDKTQIKEFEDKHWHREGPSCGDSFDYIFCPTGIGLIKKVKCNYCGEELDLSELD